MFYRDPFEVDEHLYVKGMDPYYIDKPWVQHGEQVHTSDNISSPTTEALKERSLEKAMLHDVFNNHMHMDESDHVGESSSVSNGELYPGSRKKKLDFVVKLYQSKLLYGMSDATFGSMLTLIRKHFPMCETLPPNYTCQNNCMLFWKQHVNAIVCAKCGASRYKQRKGNSRMIQCIKVPKKVLRYFPIGPRLQRLYMSSYTAKSMIWHLEIRTNNGFLRHLADSLAWKHLDNTYSNFSRECRNVRLGLASDEFNPFGKKSLGDAIDVFLQPLINDLRYLWTTSLRTYDSHRQETFTMRAALLWTINDFPAYAMLLGWSTSGEKACSTCGDDTDSLRLKHGKKRNVAENVIGILLEIEGKTKNGIRAMADLIEFGVRHNLHPQTDGACTKLLAAEYNMKPGEKRMLCQVLESIQVLDNYFSNINKCVNIQEKKLIGLKSHDLSYVDALLLELSRLFRHLSSKIGTEELFNGLSKSITLTICHLEKLFLPSFFTVMVHLIIHLADEAVVASSVTYQWMYPIENAVVVNLDECVSFCSMYMEDSVVTRHNRPGRNYDVMQCDARQELSLFGCQGKLASAVETVLQERSRFEMAHLYVLVNCPQMEEYLKSCKKHMSHVISTCGRTTIYDVEREALDSFPQWCRDNVHNIRPNDEVVIKDDIRALVAGPMHWANRYTTYVISFATTVDRNPRYGDVDYYVVVINIIELDYHNGRKFILFDCDWYDVKSKRFRTKNDEFGFILVNCEHHVYNMLDTNIEDHNTSQDIENTLGDDDIVQTRPNVAEIVIAE
ncbi:unnamed protein product [Malus baccata var. baccata]